MTKMFMKDTKKVSAAIVLVMTLLFVGVSPVLAAVKHLVNQGESLYIIGQKYGTSVAEIKAKNQLKGDTIYPGQELILGPSTYSVKRGDTLTKIANKNGVTASQLMAANGLKTDVIKPGQVLRIPTQTSVSRGSANSYTNDDLYWLARAVHGEARGESYTGKVAVAAVILNRLESNSFPNSVKGVIFEPLAFTAVADGQIYLEPDSTAIKAAREAVNGSDPTGNALYYWNPSKATSKWIWSRPIIKRIGNHVFAK